MYENVRNYKHVNLIKTHKAKTNRNEERNSQLKNNSWGPVYSTPNNEQNNWANNKETVL